MEFDEFSRHVEELWKQYRNDSDKDFLLVVLEHNEDDTVGDVAIAGYGCAACVVRVLAAMVVAGDIQHQSGERVH